MPLLPPSLRRLFGPSQSDVAHAPYLAHYQLVDKAGEVYREADVPVVFFEDGPAMAKLMLLRRTEPERGWRMVKASR
jgi:hypothetical protein